MIAKDDLNVIEGYVARDGNQYLFFYFDKPIRETCSWNDYRCDNIELPEEMFPNLKWEDDPIKVELTIKRI